MINIIGYLHAPAHMNRGRCGHEISTLIIAVSEVGIALTRSPVGIPIARPLLCGGRGSVVPHDLASSAVGPCNRVAIAPHGVAIGFKGTRSTDSSLSCVPTVNNVVVGTLPPSVISIAVVTAACICFECSVWIVAHCVLSFFLCKVNKVNKYKSVSDYRRLAMRLASTRLA